MLQGFSRGAVGTKSCCTVSANERKASSAGRLSIEPVRPQLNYAFAGSSRRYAGKFARNMARRMMYLTDAVHAAWLGTRNEPA